MNVGTNTHVAHSSTLFEILCVSFHFHPYEAAFLLVWFLIQQVPDITYRMRASSRRQTTQREKRIKRNKTKKETQYRDVCW